jgi:hypothetical protein
MRPRKFEAMQMFAVAALFFYAAFFVVSQTPDSYTDEKLAILLSWSHYGSIFSRLLLWYLSIGAMAMLVIGLLAVAFKRRWGTWVVLTATIAAFLIIPFSGVSIFAPTARFVGSVAMACVFSVLALAFLPERRSGDL